MQEQHPPGPRSVATGCADSAAVPPRTAICLDGRPSLPRTQGQPAAPESRSDTPGREDPRNRARYLPFDTDISHNSDPRGRGKKASLLLLPKRKGRTFTCMKLPLGFFCHVPVKSRNRRKHVRPPGRGGETKTSLLQSSLTTRTGSVQNVYSA